MTADVNRTFGDTAARIILLGNDTNVADRDHINTKRLGVAPSITMNMAPDTRVTLSYKAEKYPLTHKGIWNAPPPLVPLTPSAASSWPPYALAL